LQWKALLIALLKRSLFNFVDVRSPVSTNWTPRQYAPLMAN
jgi:hypothetical protein